jgi:hypothetical protein
MHNNPDDYCDPKTLKVEVSLTPTTQAATLLEIAERCHDIVEDIDAIPGSWEDGRLLGIRTVAQQQIARLENIAANIRADWSIP